MSWHVSQSVGRKAGRTSSIHDIERYFHISLYLLVLTAFLCLIGSGGIDFPATLLAGTAFVVRAVQLVRRDPRLLPERWVMLATLAYLLFFAADYWLLSRSFLPPVVHLVLFGVVIRLFSLRQERDHATLAALAFLLILASAVFTVDSLFLLCFAVFLLVAVGTFVLMEMRDSQRASTLPMIGVDGEIGNFPALLARLGTLLMVLILLTAAGIFFLLPRKSAGYLGAYSFGTDFSTGFSNRVQLGQIGQIQQSDAVAMHIQIEGDSSGGHDLYWRGIALSQFDGRNWFNPDRLPGRSLGPSSDGSFDIAAFNGAHGGARPAGPRRPVHYRVLLEPIGTNVFFLTPSVERIKGPYRGIFVSSDGSISNDDATAALGRYEADSDMSVPSLEDLRRAGSEATGPVPQMYLQLPALDPRISALAHQVSAAADNPYDRAASLEAYLKTHYGYTLQLPSQPVQDPISNFLFQRKQGHCEYFASSMAVMLRSMGIPSRVVNGFHGGEFNQITGDYIVRARDAHSWVEAYLPGAGWTTFDPTPAGADGARHYSRIALYVDAMASFWREWVVSYDKSHQLALGQTALQGSRSKWEALQRWGKRQYEAMVVWAKRGVGRVRQTKSVPPLRLSGMGAAILMLAGTGMIGRLIWRRWRTGRGATSPHQAAAIWYETMLRTLARSGNRKSAGQTAREFALGIPEVRLQEPVLEFTRIYLAARFGSSEQDAQRLPKLLEMIKSVARS